MRMRSLAAATALPALFLASTALAVRNSPDVVDEGPLESAAGARPRVSPDIVWDEPPVRAGLAPGADPWARFVADRGADASSWHSMWDRDTGVPLRIWGAGIAAPGSVASADLAERAARRLLAQYLPLLAPGASVDDFELVANVQHGDGSMRSVGFEQRWKGLRVVGGQLSFLFKRDRLIVIGSDALPNVKAALPARTAAVASLTAGASTWIEGIYGAKATVGKTSE